MTGSIGSSSDTDYYRISVPVNKTLSVTLAGTSGTGLGRGATAPGQATRPG